MSWGSHLAEGERNGKKASTQVGHGSRWDTDCSVVYSCWGPSTLLYRGQKLCLSATFHSTVTETHRHLPSKAHCQYWQFWRIVDVIWKIWGNDLHPQVCFRYYFIFLGMCQGEMLTLSVHPESERTAQSEKERVNGRKSHPTQRSLTIVNISLCSHWITLYGLTRTSAIQEHSIRVLTIVCISSNNSPERQVKYTQSHQPFAKAPPKHTFQQHGVI